MKKTFYSSLTLLAILFFGCNGDIHTGPTPADVNNTIITELNLDQNVGQLLDWYNVACQPILYKRTELGNDMVHLVYKISLNACTVNPSWASISSFKIPHVGPGGVVIYENVANDATYTLLGFQNGYVYYSIVSKKGQQLKYNISYMINPIPGLWFLVIPIDDGITNIITLMTKKGSKDLIYIYNYHDYKNNIKTLLPEK